MYNLFSPMALTGSDAILLLADSEPMLLSFSVAKWVKLNVLSRKAANKRKTACGNPTQMISCITFPFLKIWVNRLGASVCWWQVGVAGKSTHLVISVCELRGQRSSQFFTQRIRCLPESDPSECLGLALSGGESLLPPGFRFSPKIKNKIQNEA